MTTNRVDTTLPEHSWIPFYEELAHKLLDEDWRNRQPELVQMLKKMRDEGVPMHPIVDSLSSHIDPFTLLAMFTREIRPDRKIRVMEAFKSEFKMEANVPFQNPMVPTANNQSIGYFSGYDGIGGDIEILWNVFEFVFELDPSDESTDQDELVGLIDDSLNIDGVGMGKLTAGLYWVNPFNFLHIGTINGVAKLVSGEQLKDDGDATDYLRCLKRTREIVQCAFPNLNIPIWVLGDSKDKPKVWVIRAVNGKFTSDFVSKGYVFGWDTRNGDDWTQVKTRAEIEEIYRNVYPDANNNKVSQIVPQIENFVFNMKPGDYIICPGLEKDFYYSVLGKRGLFHSEQSNRRDAHWIGGPLLREELPSMAWSNQRTVFEVKGTGRDGTDRRDEFFKLIGRDDLIESPGSKQSAIKEIIPMTTNRVDTSLPEHSWIPFYEELAHKLVDEDWRNRQPELVQMLKEMKDEGVPTPKPLADYVSDLKRTHLDPFTFFALLSGVLSWTNTKPVMRSLKTRFELQADLPKVSPIIPNEVPVGMFFFDLKKVVNYVEDIEKLWNTFEFAVGVDTLDEITHQEELISRINACLPIKGVAINKLSKGLYWVNPHNFLHVNTMDAIGGKGLGIKATDGESYWRCLKRTRELVQCAFPNLNIPIWVLDDRQDDPKVWVTRGRSGELTDDFIDRRYIIGWEPGVDMSSIETRSEIEELYSTLYPEDSPERARNIVPQLENFLLKMKPGDYVMTPGLERDFFYCIVGERGPFFKDEVNRRDAWWLGGPLQKDDIPSMAWNNQRSVFEVGTRDQRNEFFKLIGRNDLIDDKPNGPCPDPNGNGIYTIQSMLDEGVFLEHEEIERMKEILQNKKNLILQGPPGVGKTFIARKLAYVLMGEKADARITSVQFHQSYSYEDFVGGLRPDVSGDQQLIFTPQDGTFLKLCDRARDDSDNKYVMLIDEVNRGNLSRVFGELLMLIEADKRTEDNAIELQHQRNSIRSDDNGKADKFFVPENVYIIGTMNLADRSLTGMNIAMRRRFGFVELEPQFDKNVFTKWLSEETNMPKDMQTRIHNKMSALNDAIAGDVSLGKNYAVGHSFFCPSEDVKDWEEWYKRVVDYEIRPLLEEYWFDKLEEAGKHVKDLKAE